MTLEWRVERLEQDIERIERQVSLKIPKAFHEHLYKQGYYHVMVLNSDDTSIYPRIEVQVLSDRLRMTFDLQGRERVIQYDFYFDDK